MRAVSDATGRREGRKIYRLAVLASHPIQYQVPLWQRLAANEEVDLTVLYCGEEGAMERKDPEFGISFKWDVPLLEGYRFRFLKNYSPRPGPGFWGKMNPGILVELWKNKYDALLVFGHFGLFNLLGFFGAWLTRTPVLLRGVSSVYYDSVLGRKAVLRIAKRLYLCNLFRFGVSGFLYIGERNKRFYGCYGVPEGKLFFFPYAVDNDFFWDESRRYRAEREEIRRELGIGSEAVVILFAAKLIPKKNPMEILVAYRNLRDLKNVALAIVGDGDLRPEMEIYVRREGLRNVFFFGFQNQREMPKYYAISDIFVRTDLPDKGDWGATVNEALACGVPVVSSNAVGSQEDLIVEGENGFVYRFGDTEGLISILRKLLQEKERREGMREACRTAIAGWSYERDVEGVLKALRYCCGHGSR